MILYLPVDFYAKYATTLNNTMEHIDLTDPDFEELKNSPDVQVSRYATCMTCPELNKIPNSLDQCKVCGCDIVKIVIFTFKQCPLDKWKN